jgi:TonB family protein
MTVLQIGQSPQRLPSRPRREVALPWCASAGIHAAALAIAGAIALSVPGRDVSPRPASGPAAVNAVRVIVPSVVFRLPRGSGGGGGGGGNRDSRPIRHATGRGHDAATLRTRQHATTLVAARLPEIAESAPSVLLDARSLASGDSMQSGLPVGGVSSGLSLGPGSGGGVGTGHGTGIGSGDGPGIGPGSGGGIGGGVYRVGNGVTAPRLLAQTTPRYTADALLRRVQGTVSLDAVVTRDGTPVNIRIVRSLDRDLDREAIEALRQWRFSPGTLGGRAVDVDVVVMIDFWIR